MDRIELWGEASIRPEHQKGGNQRHEQEIRALERREEDELLDEYGHRGEALRRLEHNHHPYKALGVSTQTRE